MSTKLNALVIGATGLVGKQLVKQLLADSRFDSVTVFVRRSTRVKHPKLVERIIDFDDLPAVRQFLKGDVLFSCLGTTLKQAKTKENQYTVDYVYQYQTAQIAAANKVPNYVLVSSTGAKMSSKVFYSRIKGELEEAVSILPFNKIRILRPSVLMGKRRDFRLGERVGAVVINSMATIVPSLKKWRGIKDYEVASAMIRAVFDTQNEAIRTEELDELFA
jgi:uncharacterized protein YbjT (DUF2867 family)